MTPAPMHLGQILSAHARLKPHDQAVQDLERRLTYQQWNTRACQLANALRALGLNKGDRVAVLAYNRVEWAEIYVAVAKAGLVAVPINFRLTAPEVQYIIDDADAAALIVDDALLSVIDEIRDDISIAPSHVIVMGEQPGASDFNCYETLISNASEAEPAVVVLADDAWCLMYTSGTTGRPKGAIRSHRGMAMLALMTGVELKLHQRDNALLVMPMFHANSLNFFTAFVHCNAKVSIYSRSSFDPEFCLQQFSDLQVSFTSLVPTQYLMLLEVSETQRRAASLDQVEKLMISSAPARADTKRAVMDMFPNTGLYELYGSTEAGWVTMLHPQEQFSKLGSVGREVVGSAPIRLLDDDGNEVSDGEPGELFSSSPYSFDGYWKRPEATAEAMRGDYLTVGDIAIRDSDGFIRLVDRKKNIIISGGENIYPSEVETLLASHAAIRDVAVVGQPDMKWGETVVAAVVLNQDHAIDKDELIAWTKNRIAGFKRPRDIVFIKPHEMPRNTTGKILHRELKQLVAAQSSRSGKT